MHTTHTPVTICTNPEKVWRLNWQSSDVHLCHVICMCTEPVDEQDWLAVQDILLRNQIQVLVHVEAGVRHLKLHVLVPHTVVKLDWKKHTEWVDVMPSF